MLDGNEIGKSFVFYSVICIEMASFWLMRHSEPVCINIQDSKHICWAPSRQAISTISLTSWRLTNRPYQPERGLEPSTSQSLSGCPNH